MQPRMSPEEVSLFRSFVRKSERYLEFGCGGSTVIATADVKAWVVSVDSSKDWLDQVGAACAAHPTRLALHLADIGPTGEWGYPVDPEMRDRWPAYHTDVWDRPETRDVDLCFVDGRFRVACFAQVILHSRPDVLIGFHDFASRSHYHRVREIAREIATTEAVSFFQPLPNARERAATLLEAFRFDPL